MDFESFGERLKRMRKMLGYTQKELGEKIGVGRTTISEYESGNIVPKQENLIKLSEILGVSVDYLTARVSFTVQFDDDFLNSDLIINHWIGSLLTNLDDYRYDFTLFGETLSEYKLELVKKQLNQLMDNLKLIHLVDENKKV